MLLGKTTKRFSVSTLSLSKSYQKLRCNWKASKLKLNIESSHYQVTVYCYWFYYYNSLGLTHFKCMLYVSNELVLLCEQPKNIYILSLR